MLRIKKLDLFIVKSFGTLLIGTFFICLFIFMMQFLWRYVEELVGKGLSMDVMAKFFYYSGLGLVPMAMPLAILLASLITFGNFGERYELLAMKTAGISLLHIMRPLIVVVILLCGVSFLFQNLIGPNAYKRLYTLIYSMKQSSPEVDIPEGVFYSEIKGYNIMVDRKDRKTGMLYDVLIYDMKDGFDNARILNAREGRIEMTSDRKHLYLHLYDGEMFENLRSRSDRLENVPYRTEQFREKHTLIEFDSEFNMADESVMSNQAISKTMLMLETSIDSMSIRNDSIGRVYYRDVAPVYTVSHTKEDSIRALSAPATDCNTDSLFRAATLAQKAKILTSAVNRADGLSSEWTMKSIQVQNNDTSIRRHWTEWHRKFTYAVSCLLFFFIGAPLGAIIRKGGLGMPVIVSVVLFIFYYIIENVGYKMARDGKWMMFFGMWLSTVVLAALGAFLTYKSNKDSVVLNADAYIEWFKRVAGIRPVRHIFRKEVIIEDPDYRHLPQRLDELTQACRNYSASHALYKLPNYYKLWVTESDQDTSMTEINNLLESVVDEMSNTRSKVLLNALNAYPIIPVSAHTKPFDKLWLNLLAGICLPVGLVFYFRIWIFRRRLHKDLQQIIFTNQNVISIISELK
ncbi:MAG: LptF/LptG family permease [Prevotellaceae bacterium]|jgi:lipopolysaccharide export system permease protein|nr:LptF/LptG family permease [Prevotellaceae bacterium]